jgi:Glycosyl transferase family 2
MALVLVLLPVYNGSAYLKEQVESILAQRDVHTLVLCRDDGSTDGSVAELEALAQRWPDRIVRITDTLGNLGASGNFSRLMDLAATRHRPPGRVRFATSPCRTRTMSGTATSCAPVWLPCASWKQTARASPRWSTATCA